MDRINEITKDCFNALAQIRQLDPASQPPPEALHQRLRSFVDSMAQKATEAGYNRDDVMDISYAIVSLIDETIFNMPGQLRQLWMTKSFQLLYFNDNNAGENFFNRLQAVMQNPQRVDVLRVYFLCMMFGFQGRYRIRGGEMELQNVVQVVEDQLRRAKVLGPEVLSPHGDRPPEAKVKSSRELPLITLSIIAVLLAAGAYVFLRWQLQNQASSVEKKIEGMNTKPAAGGGGSEAPAPAPAPANNGQ